MTDREEAARWFIHLRDAPGDKDLRQRFEDWVTADPARAREMEAFAATWSAFESPQQLERLASAIPAPNAEPEQAISRRRVLTLGMLLAGGSLAGMVGWRIWQDGARPQFAAQLESGNSEIRRETTPDGSRLILGPQSRLDVAIYARHREVMLVRGDAIFDVADDPARPFKVSFAGGELLVIGTRFSVAMLGGVVRVSVERGRVRLSDRQRSDLILQAGDVAEVTASGVVPRRDLRAADALAWEQGTLVFNDAPLAEVVAALSRFRPRPVRAAADGRVGVRLTAVVPIDQIDRFIRSLPEVASLRVEEAATETVLHAR